MGEEFTILAVVQAGRLEYEALLFMASLRASGNDQQVILAEPQPGPLWQGDPRIDDKNVRAMLLDLGAEIVPLHNRHFGDDYPYGNKIEALGLLPDKPFVFFDTDTLFLGPLAQVPFNFDLPTASLRREGTWPKPLPGWPGYTRVWQALYDRFGLDFASSLDTTREPVDWQRFLYFNAGYYFHRSPGEFGRRFLQYALSLRNDPPPELAGQKLLPWLDQIALPLVVHSLGGGRDGLPPGLLDGRVTCHYRTPSLLYARESDAAVAMFESTVSGNDIGGLVQRFDPIRAIIGNERGTHIRAMFANRSGDEDEAFFRKKLKAGGLWDR